MFSLLILSAGVRYSKQILLMLKSRLVRQEARTISQKITVGIIFLNATVKNFLELIRCFV
jgi:hypothetical protein